MTDSREATRECLAAAGEPEGEGGATPEPNEVVEDARECLTGMERSEGKEGRTPGG